MPVGVPRAFICAVFSLVGLYGTMRQPWQDLHHVIFQNMRDDILRYSQDWIPLINVGWRNNIIGWIEIEHYYSILNSGGLHVHT